MFSTALLGKAKRSPGRHLSFRGDTNGPPLPGAPASYRPTFLLDSAKMDILRSLLFGSCYKSESGLPRCHRGESLVMELNPWKPCGRGERTSSSKLSASPHVRATAHAHDHRHARLYVKPIHKRNKTKSETLSLGAQDVGQTIEYLPCIHEALHWLWGFLVGCFVKTESDVVQAFLQLSYVVEDDLELLTSGLEFLSAWMTGKCDHTQFMQCWGSSSGLGACWVSTTNRATLPG